MGVSQILIMYISSLINMTFNIIIIKIPKHTKVKNMQACKLNGIRDSYQNQEGSSLISPNHGGPPTKLPLKMMHPKSVTI